MQRRGFVRPIIGGTTIWPLVARRPWREAIVTAGLASCYGASITDGYRLAAAYAIRVLKRESVANLLVQQSTRTELVTNYKSAKALGLTFPVTLLGRAAEMIEYSALRLPVR